MNEIVSVLLVEMDDDFGVGVGIKPVTFLLQRSSQFNVIEYLAVEHDPDGLIFVVDRLPSTLEIDDAQARVREPYFIVNVETVTIRTAMMEHADHRG
jgi:hypothetical protein